MKKTTKYNKTKIVATLGPATSSSEVLKKIIKAGVDVCRLNFSHGKHDDLAKMVTKIRRINEELGSCVCILGDLQGPKHRIGEMENGGVLMKKGHHVILTTQKCIGTADKIYVSYPELAHDVKPGERVLLDDGKLEFRFTEIIDEHSVKARVIHGGMLKSKKGFNLPFTNMSVPSMTEKDHEDLKFAVEQGLEWVGLSFVRSQDDVLYLRKAIEDLGGKCRIIAKIEKPQAVKNIDRIIEVSDGIMVARGDLGVEMPMERVPMIQKQIVEKCIIASKPVIIATQMMESMIESPTPTRAEANDVANAVMDGADAVMLSAETSVGKYPVRVVESMEKILGATEINWDIYYKGQKPNPKSPTFFGDEICFTAVRISDHIKAKAIISMTYSGYTAFKIASFRPDCDIFIFTANKEILTPLSLIWNVRVFYYDREESTDDTMSEVLNILKSKKLLSKGDLVVHTASMPITAKGRTNTIKISHVD